MLIVQGGVWQICSRLAEIVGKNRVYLSTSVSAIHQVLLNAFCELM